MKIVNKKGFYALPANTLVATYAPMIFGEPFIKMDTLYGRDGEPFDYLYQEITELMSNEDGVFPDDWISLAETDPSMDLKLDMDCIGRDGCFEDDQMYAVYTSEDVREIIGRLSECVR